MQPSWQKCLGGVWGPLMTVDLNHTHFNNMEGVYIIWQGGGPVIRVGQGIIRERLAAHRRDSAVTAYQNLYVTWAPVFTSYRDGVEKHLATVLNPKVGAAFPNTNPIPVSLPWPWHM